MDKTLQAVIKLKDEMSKPLKEVKSNLDSLNKSTNSTGKKFEVFQGTMNSVGKSSMAVGGAITAGVGSALALCAKNAIEFESAFAGVKKTVDATPQQLEEINQGLRDLSGTMPQSASELAGIAESAGQLGIATENILDFTKTMAMLGDSTNLTSEEAGTSFARFANIVGMSQKDFDKLGSVTVALGNNLATTESEIVAMAMRLAGAGSQVGLTEAQILSFAGALSSVGIEAEAGGTAFSKVMSMLQLSVETGSKSLDEFAKIAGMSASEFSKLFKQDASKAIMEFVAGIGNVERNGKSATAVLSELGIEEVRLTDTLKRASGASGVFNDALNLGTQAWKENNALTKEAEQRYGTTESQIAMMKNQIQNASIVIGTALLPVIRDAVQFVAGLAEKFNGLDENTKKTIISAILITGAIGGIILVGGVLMTAISGLITVFTFLGSVIAFVCTPVGAIMAGIIALQLAIGLLSTAWKNNWGGIRDKTKAVCDEIKEWWAGLKEVLSNPIQAVVNIFKKEKTTTETTSSGNRSAFGTKRVVGNDVPYRLHEGEKVLTRTEADRYDRGLLGASGFNINISNMTIREEADIDRVASALVKKINQNRVVFG